MEITHAVDATTTVGTLGGTHEVVVRVIDSTDGAQVVPYCRPRQSSCKSDVDGYALWCHWLTPSHFSVCYLGAREAVESTEGHLVLSCVRDMANRVGRGRVPAPFHRPESEVSNGRASVKSSHSAPNVCAATSIL